MLKIKESFIVKKLFLSITFFVGYINAMNDNPMTTDFYDFNASKWEYKQDSLMSELKNSNSLKRALYCLARSMNIEASCNGSGDYIVAVQKSEDMQVLKLTSVCGASVIQSKYTLRNNCQPITVTFKSAEFINLIEEYSVDANGGFYVKQTEFGNDILTQVSNRLGKAFFSITTYDIEMAKRILPALLAKKNICDKQAQQSCSQDVVAFLKLGGILHLLNTLNADGVKDIEALTIQAAVPKPKKKCAIS